MQTSDDLVIGIEGGGTKTEWLLARMEEGGRMGVLERGSLGPGNLRLLSDSELQAIFASLPREAGCVGAYLAGCATEQDRLRLRGLLARHWPGSRISCGSDRDSGFAAAFRDRDGIAVIAGTGSAVTGRREGRMEKAGGWGQLLGDLGSGYHLAMQGLRLALSRYDLEQQVTPLAQALLDRLGLSRLDQLVAWAMEANKMSVAKLAPVVFDAAKAGDPEMTAVIQAGAKALVKYTGAVARRLGMGEPEVQLLGGLFVHHPEYYDLFRDYLSDLLPGGQVQICTRSGAIGAVWLAVREGEKLAADSAGERLFDRPDRSDQTDQTDARKPKAANHSPTELANARSANFDQLPVESMVDLFISEEHEIAKALAANRENLCHAIQIASARLKSGGRLIYVGAGTSGRLGILDASEIPPTFGAEPELVQAIMAGGEQAVFKAVEGAEDDRDMAHRMLEQRQVCSRDIVCGIAASGRTPFVLAALERARELGAATVLVTCNPARAKSIRFDAEIDLPTGPEIIAGSTRLKAGTATKVTLNILSTCCMALLGKVRGNLMIDVRASNEKLRERAVRMVCQLRGCQPQEARELLEKQGWNIRNCV